MRVFTPGSLARTTGSKYLGVLVAAKYARSLNEFRRGETIDPDAPIEQREKLTTTALHVVSSGAAEFTLTARRRPNEQP